MSGRSRRQVSSAVSSSSQQDNGEDPTAAETTPSRRGRRGRRRDDDDGDADDDEQAAGSDWPGLHAQTQPLPSRSSAAAASAQDDDIEFIIDDAEAAEADGRSSTAAAAARGGSHAPSATAASYSHSHSPSVNPAVLHSLPENLRGFLAPIEARRRPGQAPLDHQSRSTRLRLLSQYSKLSEDMKVNPFLAEDNLQLQYAVHAADVLNSSVSHITEEIADAEQLSNVAGQGVKKVKKILGLQTALSVQDYIARLQEEFNGVEGEVDWLKLGEATEQLHRTARITPFLRGSFQHLSAPKQRKRREKRPEDKLKATAALTLESDNGLESKQTQGRQAYMRHHFRRLTRRRPVLIWRLLIDPASFVRTVENFFDFSFLVREGVVSMEFRDDDAQLGFPFVRWRDNEQQRQKQRKRMQETLNRLQAKLAEDRGRDKNEGQEKDREAAGNGDAEQQPSADNGRQQWQRIFGGEKAAAGARREARRRRRDERVLRILHHLKRMDDEDAAELTRRTKLSLTRQKQRFAADEDPASLTHFSPVLDWHVWSGLVLKLGLQHSLIPPMRPEDEIRWRARGQSKKEEPREEEEEEDNGDDAEGQGTGKEEKRDGGSQRQRAPRRRVREPDDEKQPDEGEEEGAAEDYEPGSQMPAAKRRRGVQEAADGGDDEYEE